MHLKLDSPPPSHLTHTRLHFFSSQQSLDLSETSLSASTNSNTLTSSNLSAFLNTLASVTSMAPTSTLLSATSLASQTSSPFLYRRIYIPTIGNEPSNDPVVYVCLSIFIFMIALAIFLLTWISWRSAREVKSSVRKRGQFKHLRNSSRFAVDSERPSWDGSSEMEQGLVRISHRIPMTDSDGDSDVDSEIDSKESKINDEEASALDSSPVPKCLRYSDPPKAPLRHMLRMPPPSSFLDGFETVYDEFQASKMGDPEESDLGVPPKQRASISERQFRELCLHVR